MKLYANPTITDFRQDVNGDIKMLKIGVDKEDAYENIIAQAEPGPTGDATLYAWRKSLGGGNYKYAYSTSTTVEVGDHLFIGNNGLDDGTITVSENAITEVGEGTFKMGNATYSRYTDGDISLT